MNPSVRVDQPLSIPIPRLRHVLPALVQLWRRHAAAEEQHCDPQEFATPGASLLSMGVGREELELLVRAQYIHLLPSQKVPGSGFPEAIAAEDALAGVHVVISETAAALVESIIHACEFDILGGGHEVDNAKPRWDARRRELWFKGALVKRFRRPGPNQKLILAAFERQGWPNRIDDPLPQDEEILPVDRLHDAVKRLSSTLDAPLLKFGGDGTGAGVCWRVVDLLSKESS